MGVVSHHVVMMMMMMMFIVDVGHDDVVIDEQHGHIGHG